LALAVIPPAASPAQTRSTPGTKGTVETVLRGGLATGWRPLVLAAVGAAGGAAGGHGEAVRARQPAPVPLPSRPVLRRQRTNTISLGFQGQYGATRGNSRIAEGFDQGPGYAFRFRYMLSPSAALGFSFEHQRYGSIVPPVSVQGDFADSHLVITTVAVEGVFYLHREREAHPYFLGGIGFATPDIIFSEGQSSRANEGLFAVAGVGLERFIRPRFSLDLSIRGSALVSNAQFTSTGQISAGIHLYPGD
jgi:hypothetical protein